MRPPWKNAESRNTRRKNKALDDPWRSAGQGRDHSPAQAAGGQVAFRRSADCMTRRARAAGDAGPACDLAAMQSSAVHTHCSCGSGIVRLVLCASGVTQPARSGLYAVIFSDASVVLSQSGMLCTVIPLPCLNNKSLWICTICVVLKIKKAAGAVTQ